MKKVILLIVMALGLQSCTKRLDVSALKNTKWTLSEWPGKTLPANASATLNFGPDNSIGGKSFCTYGGKSSMTEKTVHFEEIFGTKMFCEEVNKAETDFIADLQASNSIEITAGKLQLLRDGALLMVFTRK